MRYFKPLLITGLILLAGFYFYFSPPANPFVSFVRVWCLFQAYAVLSNFKEQLRFYAWWHQSKLSDAHLRGLGTNGYPLFGFIKLPALSVSALRFVGFGYAAMLILGALFAHLPYVGIIFICATLLALFYFSSLWAERNASYHREYLTLAILFYLSFTPDFYGNTGHSDAIVLLIQAHIVSIYLAGALQKIACSVLARRLWSTASPHSYMWHAMWSKPYYKWFQRFMFLRPRWMGLGAGVVLLAELLFFTQFWLPHEMRIAIVVLLILFHAGVFVLQGIDYITFWNPAFLLWFIVPAVPFEQTFASLWSPALFLALLFCLAQLIYAFSFLEDLNINIAPFTCCPMFVTVCNFNEALPHYYTLWDLKSPIVFERLEWVYPYLRPECGLGLVESDISKMPFRFIGFGHYTKPDQLPALQQKWFYTDLVKDGFFLFANYDVDPALARALSDFMIWLHEENATRSIYDAAFLKEVLQRHDACMRAFQADLGYANVDKRGFIDARLTEKLA